MNFEFAGLTSTLASLATNLVGNLGYGGLAAGLLIDSAGVPIPSEILLPLAGALIREGRFNFAAVLLAAVLAQTLGAALSYWIGASGGLALVKRYGRYVLFSERELAHTEAWFKRYGALAAGLGRVIPGIRTYIGYPAGVAKQPFGVFIAATVVGSAVWSLLLVVLGYELSGHLSTIDAVFHRLTLLVLGLLVAAAVWYGYRRLKKA